MNGGTGLNFRFLDNREVGNFCSGLGLQFSEDKMVLEGARESLFLQRIAIFKELVLRAKHAERSPS